MPDRAAGNAFQGYAVALSADGNTAVLVGGPAVNTNAGAAWVFTRTGNVSVGDGSIDLPVEYVFHQNFPNPFNPTTTINYSLPRREWMRLSVYDVLGREIATLVNEVKQPGAYSVQWDASGYHGGIYFCRLQARGYMETKRLILLR